MSTRNRLAAVVLCAGGVACVANAQPTVTEDFGTIPQETITRAIPLSGNQVFWFKLSIPAIAANASGPGSLYLDIRTSEPGGGTITDTEMALYDATGAYATGTSGSSTDDDDGPGTASALSYGMTCPSRANAGAGSQSAGVVFNGRDGGLAAGEYYLAVVPYNASFSGTNWGVTPGSQTGNMTLEVTLGAGTEPLPAPTFTAGSATSVLPGDNMLVTATAAACGAATSATLDTSAWGGSASVSMFDDGTGGDATAGDNVWSAIVQVPAPTTPGVYTLVATGTNSSGSGTRDISATVVAPPATLTASGGVYTEVEDNNTKPRANRILALGAGESISGTTTGTSTTTAGNGSADYFRVTTSAAPLGIYRHRLQLTSTGANTGTIRGLSQSSGVVSASSDSEVQGTSSSTTPSRFNQWYGFGKSETIYYRVTGSSSTSAPYTSAYSVEPVTPVSLGTFAPGSLVITTIGQGHTSDTDMWVYDGGLNAIPGYGNDDESTAEGGTGSTTQSRLTRDFAPGTYYLMISNWNTANDQASPATDDYRGGNVMDFANAVANSSTSVIANMQFAITDANGTQTFPASKPSAYEVYWATFTVAEPGPTCGPQDFNGDGDFGTDQDIEAFFACLGGNCCATCWPAGADFNGDGDIGTDQDIEAFFRVLGGGSC